MPRPLGTGPKAQRGKWTLRTTSMIAEGHNRIFRIAVWTAPRPATSLGAWVGGSLARPLTVSAFAAVSEESNDPDGMKGME